MPSGIHSAGFEDSDLLRGVPWPKKVDPLNYGRIL